MGSMEQIFTIFNDLKIEGWGPAAEILRIPGLSEISLDKMQKLWNKIHNKYESLQTQVLTSNNIYEYDQIYIGCLPFKIKKLNNETSYHPILVRELNHRFLLLNDYKLTKKDLNNDKYDISIIQPLYRIFIIQDCLLLNINHALIDGISGTAINLDIIRLLNNDKFNPSIIKYTTIEQHINPKYASSEISRKISNWIPTNWSLRFGKFYVNNYYLNKYNPFGLHRDDLLRFRFMYNGEFLQFPLEAYDRYNFKMDMETFDLSKQITQNILKQCKLRKVHISSLLQYITTASMIECHSELKGNYYKTLIGNAFSTTPMYKNRKKLYLGCHASSYNTIIEYYRNLEIGSDKFWNIISKISSQVLNDDMVTKVFKNKFPYINLKKFMKYALNDVDNIIGNRSMGAPTVTNPGIIYLNKKHYKYKITEWIGSSNPGIGMGAPYIVGSATINGIDKMNFCFGYGTQSISKKMAKNVVKKMKQKFKIIAFYRQSKL